MASTNSTTHYELSQYIGTDKPTYLVDYNQDMGKIDAGIYAAKSEADTNATSIGTLSNLTTTAKTNLVAAINEVDSETSGIGTLANLTTTVKTDLVSAVNEVDGLTDGIGTLANLTTTAKTNLVAAVNEVDGDIGDLSTLTTTAKSSLVASLNEVDGDIGNLSSLTTTAKGSTVAAINEIDGFVDYMTLTDYRTLTRSSTSGTSASGDLNVALNADGTFGKIYGVLSVTNPSSNPVLTYKNSGIMGVTETFRINPAGFVQQNGTNSIANAIIEIIPPTGAETSATITVRSPIYSNSSYTILLFPCMYVFKNFGDVE